MKNSIDENTTTTTTQIEHPKTIAAREKIKNIFNYLGFEITEEKKYHCKNNIGEEINPPYRSDLHIKMEFNLELDPDQGHRNSRHNIQKDEWKDKNIYDQYCVKTVRIDPKDVNKRNYSFWHLMAEVSSQLSDKEKYTN